VNCSDRVAEILVRDNEVRAARIRGIQSEIVAINKARLLRAEMLERYSYGCVPPHWDKAFARRLRLLYDQQSALAYEIASLKPGDGYFIREPVSGWEVRKICAQILMIN
jgi:hypothetical protein